MAGTLAALRRHRKIVFDPAIAAHNGRVVKLIGDGTLAEFGSVVDAVNCAVAVQLSGASDKTTLPAIVLRIGINLGDVITDSDDIYGDGVNIAARLEAMAEPGGICVSRVVRDQIRDKLPYPFEDMGEQSVKNIARPVRAYAMSAAAVASTPLVAAQAKPEPARRSIILQRGVIAASLFVAIGLAIVAWWAWPKGNSPAVSVQAPAAASPQIPPAVASTPAPRLSIVVLPFANLSNDPEQEYFVDGVTDDLTTDLSRISDSFVIARNTAFTYKGKAVDAKQIGRDLGVRYVVEGSVRRGGDQILVNVQLIDAESGAHVWADRFDTDRRNLAEAQSEITGRLARTLNLELVREQVGDVEAVDSTLAQLVDIGVLRADDVGGIRRAILSHKAYESVPVKLQLDEQEMARFAVHRYELPGVDIRASLARHYPFHEMGVHAIGYVSAINEEDLKRIDSAEYAGTSLIGKLGVSRPTLRQASAQVLQENLISIRRGVGGGYFARLPDSMTVSRIAALYLQSREADLEEITHAMKPLRIEVAVLATRNRDPAARRDLNEFLARETAASSDNEHGYRAFLKSEREFGRLLGQMSGNSVLTLFLSILYDFTALLRRDEDVLLNRPDRVAAYREHRARMAQAILDGDEEIAVVATRRCSELISEWMHEDFAGRGFEDTSMQERHSDGPGKG